MIAVLTGDLVCSGASLSTLVQEHGEVIVAGRLTITHQLYGGFTKVLRGIDDHIHQVLPHDIHKFYFKELG